MRSLMRIGILSRWNATCGVSVHAESIGHELINMGHNVVVFAPTLESANRDWHHIKIDTMDEDFVVRCFDEADDEGKGGRICIDRILSYDLDVLLVEAYHRIPLHDLEDLLRKVSPKAKTVAVIHDGVKKWVEPFARMPFDAIVVFDERYINELLYDIPGGNKRKIHIIPYPCVEVKVDRKLRPEFAKDGKILFFSFGRQPVREYLDYVYVLRKLRYHYDIVYWIIRADRRMPELEDTWLIQWVRRPPLDELYRYLAGADVHLLPKGKTKNVVISSTCFQCLGAPCPMVVPDTRHFELLPVDEEGVGPVVKYKDREDLLAKVMRLIEDEEYRRKVVERAQEYVKSHSARVVASKFLELFDEI